uniref:hypothetical protein n=1 Tax=Bacillus pumilus TaxID=1408 RepID=UPI00155D9F00|nr:hypothetical protein [Bacillus pumilus]
MRKTPSFRMLFSIIKWSGGKFKGKIKLPRFSRQPEGPKEILRTFFALVDSNKRNRKSRS